MDEFWSVQTLVKGDSGTPWWRTENSMVSNNEAAELMAEVYVKRGKKVRIMYHEKRVVWRSE